MDTIVVGCRVRHKKGGPELTVCQILLKIPAFNPDDEVGVWWIDNNPALHVEVYRRGELNFVSPGKGLTFQDETIIDDSWENMFNEEELKATIVHDTAVPEARVTQNKGEVAEFSDGTAISRQRPYLNTDFGLTQILQMDGFKYVFAVGNTVSECKKRLADPEAREGGDGRGTGMGLKK